jgi:hypothetical protein
VKGWKGYKVNKKDLGRMLEYRQKVQLKAQNVGKVQQVNIGRSNNCIKSHTKVWKGTGQMQGG